MDTDSNPKLVDITPEDSAVQVFRRGEIPQDTIDQQIREQEIIEEQEHLEENIALRQSALAKLAALGLTEEEAKAVIGL